MLLCQPFLPQCSGVQSCWAVIQIQRTAFIPSFFRNFCSFLNHWQGRRVQVKEVHVSGMSSCGLIKMYKIISMLCAEQLGWILWRGRAWRGTWCAQLSPCNSHCSWQQLWVIPRGSAAAPAWALALFPLPSPQGGFPSLFSPRILCKLGVLCSLCA